MKVAVFSAKPYELEYLDKFNQDHKHQLVYFDASLNIDTTNLALGFTAVCVFVNDKIDRPTIEKLAKNGVKLIDLRSAGFNNVDLEAAAEQQIKVLRVPAYSPQAVAEHAVALIMTLNRKTHKAYNRVREGNFSLENLTGFNLYKKTVGVIGTGQIGAAFCRIMLGFGCKVIAHDLIRSETLIGLGVEYQSMDALLSQSDIISLHCPLNPATHYLLNDLTFSKMKKGVMLINTSRGALINTTDAIEALKSGKLGYLGIDVYEQEENLFFKDLSESLVQDDVIERLMAFHNVLITPHQGFFTQEALDEIATVTLKNFTDFEEGLALENEVKLGK
ncbi:2-hydroxyacid dehydrogenase [Haliscomenobacter hydrossis]|uniref:D-lactate dehydrogenase n=1 Tax=Haliscomenobacter hydrossis (strain ATCC 27775 / DSM 1100 / LMG 10767 / O) TaxID=760192 RepID=F4KUT1_HALH1|nr:2-hydroxyacid dehydrogenase [Haliscomenobacter hydrossis]AEE53484.1 D-lactate dehydrogenase [Haliscomenobacter hydrossis DSM 1100]